METTKYTYYQEFKSKKGDQQTFIIRSLKKSDLQEVVELAVEVNMAFNPATINFPIISIDEYKKQVHERISSAIDQDMSVVAVDISKNKIIGSMGARDNSKSYKISTISGFEPFAECFGIFRKKFPQYYEFNEEKKSANLYDLIVHKDFQGLGIASELVNVVYYHPKLKIYNIIEASAVSSFSLKIFQNLGFKVIDTIELETMETSRGERPFKNIKDNLQKKLLSSDHIYLSLVILDRTN